MLSVIDKPATEKIPAINALQKADTPVHGWYRFVLSYPPHLVRQYVEVFGVSRTDRLLDPFCGTGTTLVEAKKLGIPSLGCDAHPFAALASRVKTNWSLSVLRLRRLLSEIVSLAERELARQGLESMSSEAAFVQHRLEEQELLVGLTEEEQDLLPTGFVSARPLRRLLSVRGAIEDHLTDDDPAVREFFLLALAYVIANGAGNFAFGPEIYRTKPKPDHDVLGHFARHADLMIDELQSQQRAGKARVPAEVLESDARELAGLPRGFSAVITSPPYPNEKDYTRTTRVESILLGLVTNRDSLRGVKENLLRSNTRNVFVDDRDSEEVREFSSIQKVCATIEARRIELSKTSGFERLYHKVVAHYFGGMRRHFRALHPRLRAGAKLAYVVGDQLSFLMVPVPTAKLLGEVAEAEGFRIIGCDLWRERIGTKVRNCPNGQRTVRVREEILLLQKF
ncbi:MAG: hypothetical protein HYY24_04420 [Verrucomicrobia bacterium]|nr:hypothetical protein [Verrucomicrobiota bacterium]